MPGGQRAEAGWQEEGQVSCRAATPLTPWPSLDFFPHCPLLTWTSARADHIQI